MVFAVDQTDRKWSTLINFNIIWSVLINNQSKLQVLVCFDQQSTKMINIDQFWSNLICFDLSQFDLCWSTELKRYMILFGILCQSSIYVFFCGFSRSMFDTKSTSKYHKYTKIDQVFVHFWSFWATANTTETAIIKGKQ